jgi:ATP-dependent exoDNAse (exonuclease V) beta subunit
VVLVHAEGDRLLAAGDAPQLRQRAGGDDRLELGHRALDGGLLHGQAVGIGRGHHQLPLSEADEDASARDKEESKRLLYVALTRARDRLYLSGTVQDGKFRAGRGSLAETLPDGMKNRFVAAMIDT